MTVPYIFANQVGTISLAELDANFSAVGNAASAATVTANAQPNITSVGTLTTLSVSGNIVGGLFVGNGAGLSGVVAVGNVGVASQLSNGSSSFNIDVANGNIVGNVGGTGNIYTFTNLGLLVDGYTSASGNITGVNILTAGNLSATGYVFGNGSRLRSLSAANIVGTVANATYALSANTANVATRAANATYANVSGSASFATNATQAQFANTVTTNAQPNITSVGTLNTLSVSGNLYMTTNSRIFGDFSNTDRESRTAIQNISNNFTSLSVIPGNGYSTTGANAISTVNLFFSSDLNNSPFTMLAQRGDYGYVGTARNGTANILPLYIGTSSGFSNRSAILIEANSQDVSALANLTAAGSISATGNVQGNYFIGNGSQLTGISVSTSLAGNLVGNINANTFYINNLVSLSTSGNIRSGNLTANGVIYGNTIYGNVNGVFGEVNANLISSTGNVIGSDIYTLGVVSATGNIRGGNINTVGIVTATGNVYGNYIIANNFVGSGAGTPTLSSPTNLVLSAGTSVQVTGGGTFRLPSLTTADIANLIPANGDIIYNSSLNKFQGYENGAWGNLI